MYLSFFRNASIGLLVLLLAMLQLVRCSSSSDGEEATVPPPRVLSLGITVLGRSISTELEDADKHVETHWSFGDGTTAQTSEPRHVYTRSGSYEIVVQVTDHNYQTQNLAKWVEIEPAPDCGSSWTWPGRGLTGNNLTRVVWGTPGFVAVGGNGEMLFSPDGLDWCSVTSGRSEWINDVVWAGDQFIAVARGTRLGIQENHRYTVILTSEDGINWHNGPTPGNLHLATLAYDGKHLIATGSGNPSSSDPRQGLVSHASIYILADNGNWEKSTYLGNWAADLVWSEGRFVVGAGISTTYYSNPSEYFLVSEDGLTWEKHDPIKPFRSITFNGTRYVGIYANELWSSINGFDWSLVMPFEGQLASVSWSGGRFIAIGSQGLVLTSVTGLDWVAAQVEDRERDLRDLAFNGMVWVAAGRDGQLLWSSDSEHWSSANEHRLQIDQHLRAVTAGPDGFLAGGYGGTVLNSRDGIDWETTVIAQDATITGLAFANSDRIAVGYQGQGSDYQFSRKGHIWENTDASWQLVFSEDEDYFSDVAVHHGAVLAVGIKGHYAWRSENQWHRGQIPFDDGMVSVTHDGDTFVVLTWRGRILRIQDQTVTQVGSIPNDLFFSPLSLFIKDNMMLVGGMDNEFQPYESLFLKSTNGLTWEVLPQPTDLVIHDILWTGSTLLAVGDHQRLRYWNGRDRNGLVYSPFLASDDGAEWAQIKGNFSSLYAIASYNGVSVAVGDHGTLLRRLEAGSE